MPKKAALPSAFTKRNEELRKKLNDLKRYVPQTNTRLTLHGEIGEQCAKIAEEKGLKWYKNSKDTARSIRKFMLGTQDMSWDRMAVIDLFCAGIEAARRIGIGERAGVPFTGGLAARLRDEEVTEAVARTLPDQDSGLKPIPASRLQELEKAVQPVTDDPEIHAIEVIHELCDTLDGAAIKRVLLWTAARHGVQLA